MTLGERIASLRKEKGLSQEALGGLVGVTRQAVSKWENGTSDPSTSNLCALAKLYGNSWSRWLGSMLRRSAAFAVGTAGH